MARETPPIFNQAAVEASGRGIVIATSAASATMLAAHKVTATTFNNAEAIRRGHDKLFRDRAVYIAPDEGDDDIATGFAWRLHGIASEVKIVRPPDTHGSIEQWLANGGSKDRLVGYIKDTAPFTPMNQPSDDQSIVKKDTTDWRAHLITNEDGKIKPGVHNAQILLAYHPDLVGVLAYNRYAHSVDIMRRPPWDTEPGITYPHILTDVDDTRMTAWLERHGCRLGINVVHNAAISAAHHAPYNPLREYLLALRHDGKPRLDSALADYFGCENNEYSQAVGSRFFISAVARALDPGCKVDTMLILEGGQGALKSSAVAELFGVDFFSDELADIGSKDAAMQMQGIWCIEVQELTTMYRAEANRLKEFLSRREDRYRPPYGRNLIKAKRQCVFVGTVNPEGGYLKDATGARRFWPIKCSDIDMPLIKRERDQLWAETVARFQAGERWWFTREEDRIVLAEQADRYETDPWDDKVLPYAALRGEVTISDVLDRLDVPNAQRDQQKQKRVAKILQAHGYERRQIRVEGDRRWVYSRGED